MASIQPMKVCLRHLQQFRRYPEVGAKFSPLCTTTILATGEIHKTVKCTFVHGKILLLSLNRGVEKSVLVTCKLFFSSSFFSFKEQHCSTRRCSTGVTVVLPLIQHQRYSPSLSKQTGMCLQMWRQLRIRSYVWHEERMSSSTNVAVMLIALLSIVAV